MSDPFAGERLAYCRRIAELIYALEKAKGELNQALDERQANFIMCGEIAAAKDREIAALEAEIEWLKGNGAPDPAEAMRAKCEEVARQATTRKKCVAAIAALKSNGEGSDDGGMRFGELGWGNDLKDFDAFGNIRPKKS